MKISCSVLAFLLLLPSALARSIGNTQSGPLLPRDLILDPQESIAKSVLGSSTLADQQTAAETRSTRRPQKTTVPVTSSVTQRVVTITRAPASSGATTSATSSADSSSEDGDNRTTPVTSSSAETSTSSAAAASTPSVDSSSSSSLISSSSTISTTLPSATVPLNPLQNLPAYSGSASQPKAEDGTHVSAAGIAVGVVFSVIIIACIGFLVYKTCPSAKSKALLWHRPNNITRGPYNRSRHGGDEEQGMVGGMGLGLGEVSKWRQAPDTTLSKQYDLANAKMSMDSSSGDSAVSDISTPSSVIYHHRERSLRSVSSLRSHANVSPVNIPSTTGSNSAPTPVGTNRSRSYTPYRSLEDLSIGATKPQRSTAYKGLPPLPPPPGTMKVLPSYGRAKRISGIHEMC